VVSRFLLLVSALTVAGCSDQGSVVFVEVTQTGLAEPVRSLKVPVTIGQSTREFSISLPAPSTTTISFAIQLPPSIEGQIEVRVDAYSESQTLLGTGSSSTSIKRGARTDLSVAIVSNIQNDLSQDLSGLDLTSVDLATIDMAPAIWTVVNTGANPVDLNAIWGSGPDDIYIVGINGQAEHSSDFGGSWIARNLGVDLYGVWGFSGTDVYAVGDGAIFHSTDHGLTWNAGATATSVATTNFRAISGLGTSAIATAVSGPVARWDGTKWAFVSPQPTSVSTFAAYAVGCGAGKTCFYGAGASATEIYSEDGSATTWSSQMISSPMNVLRAISGVSSTDWWVVGDSGLFHTTTGNAGILHTTTKGSAYDGPTTLPASAIGKTLRGVWVVGSEVYAVGDSGEFIHSTDSGVTFTDEPIPAAANTTSFHAIWGSSAADVWAVGANGMILHKH